MKILQRIALFAVPVSLWLGLWTLAPTFAQITKDQEDQWIQEEADHPQAVKEKLQRQWKQLGDASETARLRILGRLVHLCFLLDDLDTLETLMPAVETLKPRALELHHPADGALLDIGLSMNALRNRNHAKAVEWGNEALALAKQSQNPNIILRTLAFQSDLYYRLDYDQQSIQAILSAKRDLKNYPNVNPILRLMVEIDIVQQNFEADRTEKNLLLLEHYYSKIKAMKLRFQSGILAFFLADAYINLKVPDERKGDRYFKEALQIALSIGDEYTAAAAAYKVASLANNRNDPTSALQYGLQALSLTQNKGQIWRFKTQRELAITHLLLGKGEEAAQYIQRSLAEITPEQYVERIKALNVAMRIYKESHKPTEALRTAETLIEAMEAQKKAKTIAEISKSRVLLGLEASQLQNQILEKDRELAEKNAQLKTVELERVRKENTIKTMIVTFLLIAVPVLILILLYVSRQQKRIHELNIHLQTDVLGRFLPPALVQDVVDKKIVWDEHAHHMDVTIIFADLVEFTRICESKDPARISSIMNRFFSAMSRVIYSEQGTLDKFIGDAVMILFGAPVGMPQDEQIQRATSCARRMLAALDDLNKELYAEDGVRFSMRVGIHSGPVIAGMFGSAERSDYTAVGMTVNIASRIEGLARPNQILASHMVVRRLETSEWKSAGLFKLKGISEPQELFEIALTHPDSAPSRIEKYGA